MILKLDKQTLIAVWANTYSAAFAGLVLAEKNKGKGIPTNGRALPVSQEASAIADEAVKALCTLQGIPIT